MFLNFFLNGILYPIKELLSLLESEEISNYLFEGSATLWQVLCCFIVGSLLIRFLLSPVRLSVRDNSPVTMETTTRSETVVWSKTDNKQPHVTTTETERHTVSTSRRR